MPQGRGKSKPKNKKPPNMVIVSVTDSKNGRKLDISTAGNIKQTEAPTLLRLAAKMSEQQLGLE